MQILNGINLTEIIGGKRIATALQMVKDEGFNIINCSLTGAAVGTIDDSEIKTCLKMELERKPLSEPDDLVEEFALKHYAYSSGPAPSLRVHKDHNTLVRILKIDPQGPARLFTYMTGRLLFESVLSERERLGTTNARARLYFCIDLLGRLNKLPNGWHESLTPEDEFAKSAFKAIALLDSMKTAPTPELEGKAAQRCLGTLLRLDAIHNLRTHFYNEELRQRLLKLREHDNWTFQDFHSLLDEIESDGIMRLAFHRPRGNPQALTASLMMLDIDRQRAGFSMKALVDDLEKAEKQGRLTSLGAIGSNSAELIADINELIQDPNLSHKDLKPLVKLLEELRSNIHSVSASDRRIDHLRRLIARKSDGGSRTKIVRGDMATIHAARVYIDNKEKLPAQLATKVEQIIKAGTHKVPQVVQKAVNPTAGSKPKKYKGGFNAADISSITNLFSGMIKKD